MKSSSVPEAVYLLLCLWLLRFCYPIEAQNFNYTSCNNTKNYASGSAYQQNLNLTLDSLIANASLTGYCTTAKGLPPNISYGLIQCRAEISTNDCKTCASNIATSIKQMCPYQKEALMIFPACSLQYSDSLFFSTADNVIRLVLVNTQDATNPVLFRSQLGNLLGNMSSNAAADTSRLAFGRITYSKSTDIYAMVQCTRDLTANDCFGCLQNMESYIQQLDGTKIGAQLFAPSCYLRYEISSFFELSLPPSPPPSPTPPSLSPYPVAMNNSTSQSGKSSKTIIYVVAPVAVILVVVSIACGCFFWRKRRKRVDSASNIKYDDSNRFYSYGASEDANRRKESLMIGLNTLKRATRDFSDAYRLGEGGFGPLYKGKLQDGREIAVKRLSSRSKQGFEELKTEVLLVAKLMHRNLVRLLGFCLEEEEKLLVYEYLPNGSLDKVLFDQNKRVILEWQKRYNIIVGLARGLLYLHEDSQLRIVHRDLKASNILLDGSMNPKISDFGIARPFSESQTQGDTSHIAGTFGYMAPEYATQGHFSTKSDVYSFGILVLEIVTGQKSSRFQNSTNLQSFAWEHWSNGTALDLVDPAMVDLWSRNEVLNCIHVGLLCVQEAAADRPTMSEVIMMLSSYTVITPALSKPAFFVSREYSESLGSNSVDGNSAASQLHHRSTTESSQQSINEVTISDIVAR